MILLQAFTQVLSSNDIKVETITGCFLLFNQLLRQRFANLTFLGNLDLEIG
jgi:hypothetical protein